jgi:hypothetical protein
VNTNYHPDSQHINIINDGEHSAKNDTQTIKYDLWISHNTGQSDMIIVLPTTVQYTIFHFRFKYETTKFFQEFSFQVQTPHGTENC